MGPPPSAPLQSSSAHQPASSIASPIQQPRGQGGSAHAAPLSVVPSLPTVFKNGGMLKGALSFPREEELSTEQGDDFDLDFATDSEVMGSPALDNLVPAPKDKALFASQGHVGKQAASCLVMYWQEMSADRAVFRSDVKNIRKGDHALLRKRLPDATVEGGRFSLKGMYKNLPAAPLVPKGTTHEPSKADKATSDALEKRQKICREQLIKLLLPAAETTRRVADLLPIHDSPQSLVNSLFEAFGPGEDDQDFKALTPEQQLAAVTFQAALCHRRRGQNFFRQGLSCCARLVHGGLRPATATSLRCVPAVQRRPRQRAGSRGGGGILPPLCCGRGQAQGRRRGFHRLLRQGHHKPREDSFRQGGLLSLQLEEEIPSLG